MSSFSIAIDATSEDPGAELFLLDRTFAVVNKGIGRFDHALEQPAGLYRVRARIGPTVREAHLFVEPENIRLLHAPPGIRLLDAPYRIGLAERIEIRFDTIQFPSPLPLEHTSKTHEYHMGSAVLHSAGPPQERLGRGSSLFLYARAWTPPGSNHPYRRWDPFEGLSLASIDGATLWEFRDSKTKDLSNDPWAACRLELTPGAYVLRQSIRERVTEMSVIASPAWQLQIFLLAQRTRSGGASVDLSTAAILHGRDGFHTGSREGRLCEQVRFGLTQRRRTMTPTELSDLVDQKFDNPMLGIYGAHMMLMRDRVSADERETGSRSLDTREREAIEIVTRNLSRLLGDHPDVEALRVFLGERPADRAFHCPPMLLSSWEIVVRATTRMPDLIPSGCLSSRIAPRLISSAPWLLWNGRDLHSTSGTRTLSTDADRTVVTYLRRAMEQERFVRRSSEAVESKWRASRVLESRTTYQSYIGGPPTFASHAAEPSFSIDVDTMVDDTGLPLSSIYEVVTRLRANDLLGPRVTSNVRPEPPFTKGEGVPITTIDQATLSQLYTKFVPGYDSALGGAPGGDSGVPLLTPEIVAEIREQLASEPDLTLELARRALDTDMTLPDLHQFLDLMDATFANPQLAIDAEALGGAASVLPKEFAFDGMTDAAGNIRHAMNLDSHKFEGWSDVRGYGVNIASAFLKRVVLRRKANFRWAENYGSRFHYSLPRPKTKVALFSDFGTGLYHSRYIADFIASSGVSHAFHLGDVYYAGKPDEVSDYFQKPLENLVANAGLWTIAGNHDYYSGGLPFFSSMDERRNAAPTRHMQEGSYFSLETQRFRVIGLDVEYHSSGRLKETDLKRWFQSAVVDAKQKGQTIILLTSNEPFSINSGHTSSLYNDVSQLVPVSDIDLWFWGNTHYGAFFGPSAKFPGYSSCIGHGGYPYKRLNARALATDVVPYMWAETETRFPKWTGVRQDMGNNGFVLMDLDDTDRSIRLEYRDWTNDLRMTALMSAASGRLVHSNVSPAMRDVRRK